MARKDCDRDRSDDNTIYMYEVSFCAFHTVNQTACEKAQKSFQVVNK